MENLGELLIKGTDLFVAGLAGFVVEVGSLLVVQWSPISVLSSFLLDELGWRHLVSLIALELSQGAICSYLDHIITSVVSSDMKIRWPTSTVDIYVFFKVTLSVYITKVSKFIYLFIYFINSPRKRHFDSFVSLWVLWCLHVGSFLYRK